MKQQTDNVKKVIDVSKWNGTIDWAKVAADGLGAIIRCGYGDDHSYQDDPQWQRNVAEAAKYGVPFGVYIYSYAASMEQIRSEAAHVLRCMQQVTVPLAMPIFLDMEEWWDAKDKPSWMRNNVCAAANEFSRIINEAGYDVGVYASLEAWQNTGLGNYDRGWRWVAAWRSQLDYPCALWQYTNDGNVSGVNGRVDMNNLYMDVSEPVTPSPSEPASDTDALAKAVIRGEYGNNPQRREMLGAKYQPVQDRVMDYYEIANRVRRGEFGNQPYREPAIEALGYDYQTVRHIVNALEAQK